MINWYYNELLTRTVTVPTNAPPQPCSPSPCGANAVCREQNGAGSCTCIADFFGDPYSGCRPECVNNNDCSRDKACTNNKCKDPCPGVCGLNAECQVFNHAPTCICISGYIGNPMTSCHEQTSKTDASCNYVSTILLYLELVLIHRRRRSCRGRLQAKSMRRKQPMSHQEQWTRHLLVPARFYRNTAQLPSRVCSSRHVRPEPSMCSTEMRGSLPEYLRCQRSLPGRKSQSDLQLCSWLHRRSV